MDEVPNPPARPVMPPPDLPQASPTPPLERIEPGNPPSGVLPPRTGAHVSGPAAEAADDSTPEAGSVAPFNTRIIAAVIDLVLAAGLQMSAAWILPGFASKIAWLLGIAYLVTRDSLPLLGGQSVGKKAMNLKVVTLDDKALTGNWEAALIRNGVLLIPLFAFIELFILLTREGKPGRGLRLGDEWAKTRVIVAPDPPPAL